MWGHLQDNSWLSKEISYRGYKEICSAEKKQVNLASANQWFFMVRGQFLVPIPRTMFPDINMKGRYPAMSMDWEVLTKFFSNNNIQPVWLDCTNDYGTFDPQLGKWDGCMGKVWGTEYCMWWWLSLIITRLKEMKPTLSPHMTGAVSTFDHMCQCVHQDLLLLRRVFGSLNIQKKLHQSGILWRYLIRYPGH